MAKLSVGDTISMQGEVTRINEDGTVSIRLAGYDYPLTTRGEHLALVEKYRAPKMKRNIYDEAE